MHKKLMVIIGFIFILLVTACSEQAQATESPTVPETLDDVAIQMSWIHEYSFAFLHNAEKNGHYAEQGLAVTFKEGGFSETGAINPVEEVLQGNAQFGTTDAAGILLAQQQGKPVVAVLSTLHRSPNAIISLEESGIVRPQDMIGKTIAVGEGGSMQVYNQLLLSQNIDPETINTVERTSFGIDPLLNGEVDAIFGWIINEAVMIEEADRSFNAIAMSDYAVDTYNSLIFTTQELIDTNPELVQRFVTANIAGMQDILDDTEASIDNTLQFNPELDRDAQLRRINSMIPLMNVSNLPLGSMQVEVWEVAEQVLIADGVLEDPIALETVYTTQFITDSEK